MTDEIKLTKYGCNAAIQIHVLPDAQMRKLGFTDYDPARWCWMRGVWRDNITFSLSIDKKDPTVWQIDVLDEDFIQPYDYQHMIECGNPPIAASEVAEKVEECMEYLSDAGILSGHNRGDYI